MAAFEIELERFPIERLIDVVHDEFVVADVVGDEVVETRREMERGRNARLTEALDGKIDIICVRRCHVDCLLISASPFDIGIASRYCDDLQILKQSASIALEPHITLHFYRLCNSEIHPHVARRATRRVAPPT